MVIIVLHDDWHKENFDRSSLFRDKEGNKKPSCTTPNQKKVRFDKIRLSLDFFNGHPAGGVTHTHVCL